MGCYSYHILKLFSARTEIDDRSASGKSGRGCRWKRAEFPDSTRADQPPGIAEFRTQKADRWKIGRLTTRSPTNQLRLILWRHLQAWRGRCMSCFQSDI